MSNALNAEHVATVVTEMTIAFMSNYYRALEDARISLSDASEMNEDILAQALSSAVNQNLEMSEYFANVLGANGDPQWLAAVNLWKSSLQVQANYLSDPSVSSAEKLAYFITQSSSGLEYGLSGVTGDGRVVNLLKRGNLILSIPEYVDAAKNGDFGKFLGLFVGGYVGGKSALLAGGALVAVGIPTLPAIVVAGAVGRAGASTECRARQSVRR
ncbi:hypothetical protein ACF3M1_08530 [Luteimonas sp. WGS1318]|uniref:hypothetical protein n=1 Tax=Luteimonas sp. WGS1318 TaxID=3366815 RepID=UPI00372D0725